MSPWAVFGGAVLWAASIAGSCWYVHGATVDSEKAKSTEIKQAIDETREQARQGAASEIAKIKVKNTTIQGQLRTVVESHPVSADCQLDPAGVQLINDAITGKPSGSGRVGRSIVP